MVPALWQIVIIVSTILVLSANFRIYGVKNFLCLHPFWLTFRIAGAYIPFYLMFGFAFLAWFYLGLKWPFHGELLALLYAQFLTTVACVVMGSFFFVLTLDTARAMSFAGAFTAPSFAFMGVTFPVTDMSNIASTWRSLLPISHYIEAHISQSSYGVTAMQTISQISIDMARYILPLLLLIPLYKKHRRAWQIQK